MWRCEDVKMYDRRKWQTQLLEEPFAQTLSGKTALKQFFKGVGHEQPWSTIVCLFWGPTSLSSCFLRWFFFQTFPLPCFPLLKLFSFTFLVSFTWNSQKWPVSQNMDASLTPNLKNTQTIFQGGSPWPTLIHNSMFGLGAHYCVQLLPEAIFFKHSLYLFLC